MAEKNNTVYLLIFPFLTSRGKLNARNIREETEQGGIQIELMTLEGIFNQLGSSVLAYINVGMLFTSFAEKKKKKRKAHNKSTLRGCNKKTKTLKTIRSVKKNKKSFIFRKLIPGKSTFFFGR